MKFILFGWLLFANAAFANAQPPQTVWGAWKMQQDSITMIWILSDDCYMLATYTTVGNKFISATGGKFSTPANEIQLEVEFHSEQKDEVGNYHLFTYTLKGNNLMTKHHDETQTWTRIDDGHPGTLAGAWLFSGRKSKQEDEIAPYTPGARKTMKIMSGTRFQWAAFNTETKEFFGSGGGTYSTKEGKYTENIDVFSRDNSRVGASLSFDMQIAEPHWFHSGKSSKGDPIYERWSRRNSFAGQ